MAGYVFNYTFNVLGNANEMLAGILKSVENVMFACNQATQYAQNLSNALDDMLAPGAALNAELADLDAIAGVTSEEYAALEKAARYTAKEFGISAAGSVTSYKLLLSQLSPELTKNSEALDSMGKNVATLSKMMKGDATAAAEVLTTAMNQYGVSLDDPLAASDRMREMMNTMAAAAREGSAELPAIKEALSQCGIDAKAAGVSFEETNAAIQVLDKAGKKGSEGGVALRNVMSTLAQGRFLPKDVQQELAAAGIKVSDLTDKSRSLAERLQILTPVMQDSALFSKLFGKENSAAAMALVQGIPKVQQWTEAITGTTTATDQADIVMATYNERLARVQARFDDLKVSVFNCCGDLGIWAKVVSGALLPVAQLVPLIYSAAKAVVYLKTVNFAGAFSGVVSGIRKVCIELVLMNASIIHTSGYFKLFQQAGVSACRAISAAVSSIPLVGQIALILSLVIAGIKLLWDKCYGFRVMIFTVWEALKALFSFWWEQVVSLWTAIGGFFAGIWNAAKSMVQKVSDILRSVVNRIRSWIAAIRSFVTKVVGTVVVRVSSMCRPLVTAFKNVANTIKVFFGDIIGWVREKFYSLINWFIDKYNWIAEKLNLAKIARLGREAAGRSWAADHPDQPVDDSDGGGVVDGGGGGNDGDDNGGGGGGNDGDDNGGGGGGSPIGSALGGVGGASSGETDKIKNINITIDRLIDKFTITTTNLSESKERIKDAVAEALLSAVNDANYAL